MPLEETFPFPLKYIDVTRSTHTDLDVMQEKRVDDNWNVDFEQKLVRLMERIHKVYSVERETSKGIYVVQRETDKSSNDYQT